ncbi:prolyl-tRNA synthetase associated domain-containing protein 1 isoform 1 [Mus musculus]|uniref:Prolyl-tRNA synthetase domain containing 1 n=1 Tax=Mus musculus TaxID=10090 RepID=A0A0A0MQH9_MOUSE|nr:prolyl-tRNA synthetase associated domain-containing protein 1 isoform 1 [Mus musculus]|eukprot:NP_001156926.1 prolyl-tRNA synthetase associated domain-containing protein 1 isoform 1 [Mus musculus]
MAGSELRAELEQRLGALAIRTEVVEHPEMTRIYFSTHTESCLKLQFLFWPAPACATNKSVYN